MKNRLTITLAAAAVTAVTAGTVVATVPAAKAAGTAHGTVATQGVSLSVNDAPRLQSTRRGWVRPGQRVTISCQTRGDAVDGRWGRTTLWDYVDGLGYVSDGWVDTGSNGPVAGVRECSSSPETPRADPLAVNGAFSLPFARGTSYEVTQSPFGSYTHNPNHELAPWNQHAIDFGLPANTRVLAPAAGVIRETRHNEAGWGNRVILDHGNNRCSNLAHLNAIHVQRGQQVSAGSLVGLSGATGGGYNTGNHLHWGIVDCHTYLSTETPSTNETGRSYPAGSWPVSQNPGR